MTTFVLVGGFWIGAWAWRDVARRLNMLGHRAFPLTLAGLGERRAEAADAITLETHVNDVSHFLIAGDLHDVVLVGHSGAGAIVNAVAAREGRRLTELVFVDSGPVPEGRAIADFGGPTGRADTIAKAVDGRIPLPSWKEIGEASLAGLDEANRSFFRALAVPQPLRVAVDPVRLGGVVPRTLRKRAILCTIPADAVRALIAEGNPWFAPMGGAEWTPRQLDTGHWPMLSEPLKLADTLAEGHVLSRPANVAGLDWRTRRRRLAMAV
ncbi:MAG TPA: alpha/beta hydrolase [Bauldia sp.]|nr:alpha/beta hydrolase [Bauldia sp.]